MAPARALMQAAGRRREGEKTAVDAGPNAEMAAAFQRLAQHMEETGALCVSLLPYAPLIASLLFPAMVSARSCAELLQTESKLCRCFSLEPCVCLS